MFLNVVIICLFQYTTYEDCVKEAYMAAAKCRVSRLPLLTFNIYQVCDGYQDKLKRLSSFFKTKQLQFICNIFVFRIL